MSLRAAFARVVVVGALALFACGKSEPTGRTPSGARASCSADSDCVVTDSAGCCGCCPTAPAAIPKLALEQRQHKCRAMDCPACGGSIDCPRVEAMSGFAAKCVDGTCGAVRK